MKDMMKLIIMKIHFMMIQMLQKDALKERQNIVIKKVSTKKFDYYYKNLYFGRWVRRNYDN